MDYDIQVEQVNYTIVKTENTDDYGIFNFKTREVWSHKGHEELKQ